ncbi:hypothetical protein H5V45_10860 [Nocardioides sp. KIGAM211]|uniref:Uncharacterized protein n=1 Tax=Nocardioides luti TaxID=2761101 RepID=A0A7X0RGG4_9ACTN|nr:hypothetical protein [Nocardioides luti]MBB6627817.1 hypothetical protein [Nocardioides luti]
MTATPSRSTTGMPGALHALALVLDASPTAGVPLGNWRWVVRQRLAVLRDLLVVEGEHPEDGWLAARGGAALRERNTLLTRMSRLAPRVLEDPDLGAVRADLRRLLLDVTHHVQRLHDLAYDAVELELGGSE